MSATSLPENERAQDLLAERACTGLDDGAQAELDALLDAESRRGEAEAFDHTTAMLAVGFAVRDGGEALPAELERSLRGAAAAFIAAREADSATPGPYRFPAATADTGDPAEGLREEGRVPPIAWAGWLAAAAAVAFAVIVGGPTRELSPADRLDRLVASAGDVVTAGWSGLAGLGLGTQDHPLDNGIGGRVVWSDDRDEGYMEIAGLEPNDPSVFQYQLWIFDATRPVGDLPRFKALGLDLLTQRPVDGGVFDYDPDAGDAAVVPVRAKLPIGKAAIFAITRERPGGVVVSDRDIVFAAVVPAES